jgi:pre-60S factor REI1
MSSFTCLACNVAFNTADQQRFHYRTDWHRYNLKRKVAELSPISAEEFAQIILSHQTKDRITSEKIGLKYQCNLCHKTYVKENAFKNHIQSKKHKEKASESTSNDELSDVPHVYYPKHLEPKSTTSDLIVNDSEQPQEMLADEKIKKSIKLQLNDCLFCSAVSSTMEDNLEHMAQSHSFFIPDLDYLVDLPGLLTYLGEKVSVGNACLWCYSPYHDDHTELTTKGLFASLNDVRRHMVDRGHCKILYEDGADLEISDFYDFSSTYPSQTGEASEGAGSEELVSELMVDHESSQLILPSGKALGHRDYRRYYRQNIRLHSETEPSTIQTILNKYQQLGEYAAQIQRDEKRIVKNSERRRLRQEMGLGVKANKLQTFFRAQVMF